MMRASAKSFQPTPDFKLAGISQIQWSNQVILRPREAKEAFNRVVVTMIFSALTVPGQSDRNAFASQCNGVSHGFGQ